MKQAIHPQYFEQAQVICACGNKFITGSTQEVIHVELCSKCHPFYTGQEKILDTRGRVDKFKKRLEKTAQKASSPKKKLRKLI